MGLLLKVKICDLRSLHRQPYDQSGSFTRGRHVRMSDKVCGEVDIRHSHSFYFFAEIRLGICFSPKPSAYPIGNSRDSLLCHEDN